MGLFVDRLAWQAGTTTLTLVTADPVEIPIQGLGWARTGFYLWAGFHPGTSRLLVLVQTIKVDTTTAVRFPHRPEHFRIFDPRIFDPRVLGLGIPIEELETWARPRLGTVVGEPIVTQTTTETVDLTLLSAPVGANLAQASSWTVQRIDTGGYDFDARLDGDNLTCVYRRDPYAMTIDDLVRVNGSITAEQNIPIPSGNDDLRQVDSTPYAWLFLRTVDVVAGVPVLSIDDIPGGEHPQVQAVVPLMLSFDRVEQGSLAVLPPTTQQTSIGGQVVVTQLPLRLQTYIESYQKLVLIRKDSQWQWGRLQVFGAQRIPRNLSWKYGSYRVFHQHRTLITGSNAHYASLDSFGPLLLTAASVREGGGKYKKERLLDFLYHHAPFHGVLVSHYVSDAAALALARGSSGVRSWTMHFYIKRRSSLLLAV